MKPSTPLYRRTTFTFFIVSIALTWALSAFSDTGKRAEAEALTQSLVGLNRAYQAAALADRPRNLQKLIDLTVERQALLAELVKTDPGTVLRTAIPERIRMQMPAEVQPFIERRVEMEGELEVLYQDYEDGSHRLLHGLNTDGRQVALHFEAAPAGLLTGTPARVRGVLVDQSMAVSSGQDDVLTLALGGGEDGGTNGGSPAPVPNTFGEQRTLVILVNFQDDPVEPYTPEFAHDVIFGQTSDFFLENSFGQTWLGGDVVGWYTIPVESTVCDGAGIRNYAEQAASSAGFDLASYSRFVYAFPQNGCSYWGTATVGGAPSLAWLNGDLELELSGHELGHNLGLSHSHSLACDDGTSVGPGGASLDANPWPNCNSVEYGDGLDIMGWADTAHFNAYQKERLGWLNHGDSPPIITVESSGTFELSPYAAPENAPKALKILKAAEDENGNATWYYLEYRQAIGFDSAIATGMMVADNVLNGLTVHVNYEGNGGNSGYLLDMFPETYDIYEEDPALEVGETFTDPDGGSQITTDWADSAGAIVTVQLDSPVCIAASPSIDVSPFESQWVETGTPVTYTATVTNQENSNCPAAVFELAAGLPNGWVADFSEASLTLEPGVTGTSTVTVVSAASATDGFYDVTINATNASSSIYSASSTVTYVVSNPVPNQLPELLDDSAETVQGNPVSIDVLANDSDPDGHPLSLSAVTQGRNGTVSIEPGQFLTYLPGAEFAGTDSFTYTASDGNGGNAVATVTVTVVAQDVNQAPIANDDDVVMATESAVTINVLANDSDPDGDHLQILSVTEGAKGSVTINTDGTLTYTPEKRFKDVDSFGYSITDGELSASATVSVSLQQGPVDGGGGSKGGGKGGGKPKG